MISLKNTLCEKKENIADVYFINQGNDSFYYKNARMLRGEILTESNKPRYIGVTHEYLDIPGVRNYIEINNEVLFILDIGDGGAKNDKFTRDVSLLKDGLIEEPNNSRYMFYLANSYKDSGDWENAKEMYQKCISSNGWVEERWQCYYQLGKGHMSLGNFSEAIYNWLQGYNILPERLENIYEIIKHYRETSKHHLAYMFYKVAVNTKSINSPPVFLFLENDVYDYKIHYEFTIVGYYYNPENINMANYSSGVLKRHLAQDYIITNILQNYKFYTEKLYKYNKIIDIIDIQNTVLLKSFSEIKYYFDDSEMYSSSTSLVFSSDEKTLYVCVRKVNYRIRDDGSYDFKGGIVTKNHIIVLDTSSDMWKYKTHFEMDYDDKFDQYYVGIEDVKLFYSKKNNKLKYIGTRPLPRENGIVIETGVLNEINGVFSTSNSTLLSHKNDNRCEKNWVYFEDCDGNEKVIYEWNNNTGIEIGELSDNLIIKTLDDGTEYISREFIKTHLINCKNKIPKNVRGSTNGVMINNELWFVCHIVSHEEIRNYYHLFIVLDATSYEIKRVSDLFKFSESKIEYILGFVYIRSSDKLLMSYSTMDRTTDYMMVDREIIINKLNMN